MDNELLLRRIKELCDKKGVNRTTAYIESGVGKNFGSNLKTANPSKKNLFLLAKYFDCSVEYLMGITDEEDSAARAMGEVIEWLEDNGFEVQEDDTHTYSIGKNGRWCYFTNADFATESLAIRTVAEDGFELAMLDWERKHFEAATLSFNEEEMFLLTTFRNLSRAGKAQVYQSLLNIRDSEQTGKGESTNVG